MRVRTQVMLEPAQYEYLVAESLRTGLSRSELVRRAVDETFRPEARLRVGGFDDAVKALGEDGVEGELE